MNSVAELPLSLEFSRRFDGTLMTFRQEGFGDAQLRDGYGGGWNGPNGSFAGRPSRNESYGARRFIKSLLSAQLRIGSLTIRIPSDLLRAATRGPRFCLAIGV
jgi:hypothetical protein